MRQKIYFVSPWNRKKTSDMNKYILILLLITMCASTAKAEVQDVKVPPGSGSGSLGWNNITENTTNSDTSEQKSSVGVSVDINTELSLTDIISVRTKYNEEDEEAYLVGTFRF